MKKKLLTRKRKKQLLTAFMATGMMSQGLIGPTVAFATTPHPENQEFSQIKSLDPLDYQFKINSNRLVGVYGDSVEGGKLNPKKGSQVHFKARSGGGQWAHLAYFNNNGSITDLYELATLSGSGYFEGTFTIPDNVKPDTEITFSLQKVASEGITNNVTERVVFRSGSESFLAELSAEEKITVEYGATWSDTIAKNLAKVKATDKNGNDETAGVTVTGDKVDTKKPGEYTIRFNSPSGKTVQTKVIVNPAPVAQLKLILGTTYGYNSSKKTVKKDFWIQRNGVNIDYSEISAIYLDNNQLSKSDNDDRNTYGIKNDVNWYISADPNTTHTVKVILKDGSEVQETGSWNYNVPDETSLTAKEHIEVDYGTDWSNDLAKELANVKATDKNGTDETAGVQVGGDPVDTKKPGDYNIEFTSPSGKKIQTKVTVKERKIIGSEPIISATDKTYLVGETLNPLLGVTAHDPEDGSLTDKVKADASEVNMSKEGTYDLHLSVEDSDGNSTKKTVKIHVVKDMTDAPIIKGADDTKVNEGTKFDPMKDVTAEDASGKDLTKNLSYTGTVDTTPGEYSLKYYVYDSNGRVATKVRKVTVQSNDSIPVIQAPDKLTIKQGSRFDPTLYAQAFDKEDGNITDKIVVKGTIYTDKIGSQYITYEVIDSDGNKAVPKQMEVNVVETLGNAPELKGVDNLEIKLGDDFDPKAGVTAYDEEDGDLTDKIVIGGIVNTGKVDVYEVIYTVWDADFNTVTAVREVKVIDPEVDPVIEANDFSVEYKSDLTDKLAIEKGKAKAFDKYGKEEGVKVKDSKVDTSKPGNYDLTFISDSGKELTIQVTVNEPSEENATITSEKTIEVEYGSDWSNDIAKELAKVKATDKYGNDESAGVKVAGDPVDTKKPAEYTVEFTSSSGKTTTTKVTVKEPSEENATITSEKTIEVGYNTDWSNDIAKELAKVKATDKYGNDETASVKVAGDPVDTKKPGEYTVEFTSTSGKTTKTTVVVHEQAPQKPTIDAVKAGAGRATGTGRVGEKIIIAVNGTVVGEGKVKADGTYDIITGSYRAKAGEKYTAQAFNSEDVGSELAETTVIATSGKVTPNDYTIGDKNVTGTYTDDVTTIKLFIDGQEQAPISGSSVQNGQFTYYVGDMIKSGQKVTVVGYDKYGKRLDEKEVKVFNKAAVEAPLVNDIFEDDTIVTGKGQAGSVVYVKTGSTVIGQAIVKDDGTFEAKINPQKQGTKLTFTAEKDGVSSEAVEKVVLDKKPGKPTIDAIKEGAGRVTGTGQAGDKLEVKVGNTVVGTGVVKADGTFDVLTGSYRAKLNDVYTVTALNQNNVASEPTTQTVVTTSGKLSPNKYLLGDVTVTGTYTGDVTTIKMFIDGVDQPMISGVDVQNGQFTYYVGDKIKEGQNVSLVAFDKYAKRLDEQKVVIERRSVEKPVLDSIYAGDTVVTGTGEAGSTVYIKDATGKIIGQNEVQADGTVSIKIPAQKEKTVLTVMAKKSNEPSESFEATVLAPRPDKPAVDAVKEGAGRVTGKAQAGMTIKITVNGKEVGTGTADHEGQFNIITSNRAKAGDKYEIQAFNDDNIGSTITEVVAVITKGSITLNTFTLGDKVITGDYTGDVSSIRLYIDNVDQGSIGGTSLADGKFSYYVGTVLIGADNNVQLTAFDTYGKKLDTQTVKIN